MWAYLASPEALRLAFARAITNAVTGRGGLFRYVVSV